MLSNYYVESWGGGGDDIKKKKRKKLMKLSEEEKGKTFFCKEYYGFTSSSSSSSTRFELFAPFINYSICRSGFVYSNHCTLLDTPDCKATGKTHRNVFFFIELARLNVVLYLFFNSWLTHYQISTDLWYCIKFYVDLN